MPTYTYIWAEVVGGVAETAPGIATYSAPVVAAADTWNFNVFVEDGHGNVALATANLTIEP
jgi:hypothetical protein